MLAEIYREEAEVYATQGQPDTSRSMLMSSLRFYLEAALTGEGEPGLELINKIEALRVRFNAQTLPVETRLALMDHLESLLGLGDDFLEAVRLTRADLRADFTALESCELN